MPPGFRRTLFIAAFFFFCALALAGFLARRLPKPEEPLIPIYPDHQMEKRYFLEATGVQVLYYRVPENYPSIRVFDFYSKQMGQLGYQVDPPGNIPAWEIGKEGKDSRDWILKQSWIGPGRLRVLQLDIIAVEKITRDPQSDRLISREFEPGLQVNLRLSRKAVLGGETAPRAGKIISEMGAMMKSATEYLWFNTKARREYINITDKVEEAVRKSGIQEGMVLVSAMHITAGIYVNDAESGLIQDIDDWADKLAPFGPDYRHHRTGEDNGDAHLKSLLIHHQVIVPITEGRLDLGPWQQIYYAEFDGRRRKRVVIKALGD